LFAMVTTFSAITTPRPNTSCTTRPRALDSVLLWASALKAPWLG
jgi:hypothetical protein